MGQVPEQTWWLLKAVVCILPILGGCLAARWMALRGRMAGAAAVWTRLASLLAAAGAIALLAALLVWMM